MYVAHIITPLVAALTVVLLLLPSILVNGYWLGYLLFSALVVFAVTYITQRLVERSMIYEHITQQEERVIQARAVAGHPRGPPLA